MSCPSLIRRFINQLPEGQIFTTRDCLNFGPRDSVDKALQHMVNTDFITRLTRGVFIRSIYLRRLPTNKEMAIIKARAFGKELKIHGRDTASETGLVPTANAEPTYYVDGSSSSFEYNGERINLKKASKKRLVMDDSKAGLAIRALWSIGEHNFRLKHLNKIAHYWHSNREEMEKILVSKAWMPAWLGDHFDPKDYLSKQSAYSVKVKDSGPRLTVRSPVGSYSPRHQVPPDIAVAINREYVFPLRLLG